MSHLNQVNMFAMSGVYDYVSIDGLEFTDSILDTSLFSILIAFKFDFSNWSITGVKTTTEFNHLIVLPILFIGEEYNSSISNILIENSNIGFIVLESIFEIGYAT